MTGTVRGTMSAPRERKSTSARNTAGIAAAERDAVEVGERSELPRRTLDAEKPVGGERQREGQRACGRDRLDARLKLGPTPAGGES